VSTKLKGTHSTLALDSIYPDAVKLVSVHLTGITPAPLSIHIMSLGQRNHCDIVESPGNSDALTNFTHGEGHCPAVESCIILPNIRVTYLHIYIYMYNDITHHYSLRTNKKLKNKTAAVSENP